MRALFRLAGAALSIALCISPLSADTNVSGSISVDTTWSLTGNPYIVTGYLSVASGKRLTIEPGVTVKVASGGEISVDGTLTAIGTSSSGITFTSNATTPGRGSWGGIRLAGSTSVATQLTYVTISYAGSANGAAVYIDRGLTNFDHVTVTESSTLGIYNRSTTTGSFSFVTVSNCTSSGMLIEDGSGYWSGTHTVTDSTFTGNGAYGVDFRIRGRAILTNSAITNNTGYAIGSEPNTDLQGLTGLTVSGNGAGAKNAIEYRTGQIYVADEIWRQPESLPRIATGYVTVNSGRRLTIEPGVTVKVASGAEITVNGTLTAIGTSSNGITFTSNATTPARGSWGGIRLAGPANVATQLTYVTISYAGSANGAAVYIDRGLTNFDHVTVTESSTLGIYNRSTTTGSFSFVTVSNCTSSGMLIEDGSGYWSGTHTVSDSTFTGNGAYGVDFRIRGRAILTNSAITNNTGYAIGSEPNTDLQGLTGLTVSGNGAGAKNAIEYRTGQIYVADEVWRQPESLPRVAMGHITVGNGRKLTIESGTVVKFLSGTLTISGRLSATGTADRRITLTGATSSRGSWQGVQLNAGVNPASDLSYVDILYAGGEWAAAALIIDAGSLVTEGLTISESASRGIYTRTRSAASFTGLTVSNNSSHGMQIEDGSGYGTGLHTITSSSFTGNAGFGVFADARANLTIDHSAFTGNTSGGLNSASALVDSRRCYWGHASGPSGSGFGTGQSVSTFVQFEPWLTSAPVPAHRFATHQARNRTFNPAISTTGRHDFTLSASGTWTAVISSLSGTVIRTFTGSGTTGQAAWDGRDGGGVLQTDGTYLYELQTTSGGGTAGASLRGRNIIDSTKTLTVTALAASPLFFSPNGDSVSDTTSFSASPSFDDAAWTLEIRNPSSSIVRAASGTGPVLFVWDGKNASSVLQPDATYTASLSVTAGSATAAGSRSVTLDVAPPVASFAFPTAGQILSNVRQSNSGSFSIVGTASDANLASWVLEYGPGASPSVWYVVNSGTASVSSGELGVWSTLNHTNSNYTLGNGPNSLRLTVTDTSGGISTTVVVPTIGHFKVERNIDYLNVAAGGTVSISSVVPFALSETVTIRNGAGATVRTLFSGTRAAGTHTDVWDGKGESSAMLPDGPYVYIATASEGTDSMTWDMGAYPKGGWPSAQTPSLTGNLDPANNSPLTISFSTGAMVRGSIQAGLNSGNIFGTDCVQIKEIFGTECLTDWDYYPPGGHTFLWWGTAADGRRLKAVGGLNVVFRVDNVPYNTILVHGTTPGIGNVVITPPVFNPGAATPPMTSPAAGTQSVSFNLGTFSGRTASVTVRFVNQKSLSALRTIVLSAQAAGARTVTWDGKADNGMPVAPGDYTVVITAVDSLGNSVTQNAMMKVQY